MGGRDKEGLGFRGRRSVIPGHTTPQEYPAREEKGPRNPAQLSHRPACRSAFSSLREGAHLALTRLGWGEADSNPEPASCP